MADGEPTAGINHITISPGRGITTWQSGPNLQSIYNSSFNLDNTSEARDINGRIWLGTPDTPVQPILTCDPRKGVSGNQFINGSCFTVPQQGQNGPFQLPYIHGPAFFNTDMTVAKTFKITETQNLQFRLTALNWLNHPLVSFNNTATDNMNLRFSQNASWQWVQTNQFFGMADVKYGRRIFALTLKYSF